VRQHFKDAFERGRAWWDSNFLGASLLKMYEIDGRNRAITLAGQAFIALVPLLIVLASWNLGTGDQGLGEAIVDYFNLQGSTADAVQTLFSTPPSATGGITFFGFIILVVSLGSFARSMQRMYEAVWELPKRGVLGTLDGLGGTVLLIIAFSGLAWIGSLFASVTHNRLIALPLQLLLAVPMWVLFIRLMLSRRRSARDVLPSAIVSSLAQVILSWATQVYVPHLIEVDAQRYGVIGVAFAIVSWLVIVAYLMVGTAVVGAELGAWLNKRKHPERKAAATKA
jgi:membrane protein